MLNLAWSTSTTSPTISKTAAQAAKRIFANAGRSKPRRRLDGIS
jgi:hypothetical protein